jgi:hypothetical protein
MEADAPLPPDIVEDAVGRLCEALAILETIDACNLLAELPADPMAQAGHQRAVSLLGILRRELNALKHELQAGGQAQDAIGRALTRFATGRSPP